MSDYVRCHGCPAPEQCAEWSQCWDRTAGLIGFGASRVLVTQPKCWHVFAASSPAPGVIVSKCSNCGQVRDA